MPNRKMIDIGSHGTSYYLSRKTLYGCPMMKKGGYDIQACGIVEESPQSFKAGHKQVLKRLGISKKADVERILTKIEYY